MSQTTTDRYPVCGSCGAFLPDDMSQADCCADPRSGGWHVTERHADGSIRHQWTEFAEDAQ